MGCFNTDGNRFELMRTGSAEFRLQDLTITAEDRLQLKEVFDSFPQSVETMLTLKNY